MLTFLRSAAGTFIAKLLLGLLIASFAIWGIAGASFNFASGTLASVGRIKISAADFQREYFLEIDRLGRQIGRPLTPAQARQFGIDGQVLARLVNQATLDDRAAAFGLGISHERVADEILKDPSFLGAKGEFDPYRYQQLLAGAGLSEADFLKEQRKSYRRQQVIDTFIADVAVPDVLARAVKTHADEERTVDYIAIDIRDIAPVGIPGESALEAFFDRKKQAYRAPEYRTISYIALQASDLGGADKIGDDDAKTFYEKNKNRYSKAEKRSIRRIAFGSETAAREAETRLKGGLTFDTLAEEMNLKAEDLSLGILAKDAVLDKKLAEVAFSLPAKTASGAVDGDFGKAIVFVDEIEAGTVEPFEAVSSAIKTELASERNNRELLEKFDLIEDARAAGNTYAEIAGKFSLKLMKIEDVSKTGELRAGGKIADSAPGSDSLLSEAFLSDVGIENDVIEIGRDGFVWYEVNDIKPARERPLKEVKDKAREDWIAEETAKAVTAKADELVKALKDGKPISVLAADLGREVVRVNGVKRAQPADGLSVEAVDRIFKGTKGYAVSAPGERANEISIMQVADIQQATVPAETDLQIKTSLADALQNDILETYILRVREREGMAINPEAIERAAGLDRQGGYN